MSGRAQWILAGFSAAAATAFVWIGIERPMWLDEANTIRVAEYGFSGIKGALRGENNLPFYYFILSAWIRIFGDSEVAARLLSGLFYVGGVIAAFLVGETAFQTRRAAWLSAFFYLSSMQAVSQAQNVRMYAFLGMIAGFSAWGFLRTFGEERRGRSVWTIYVGINAIGILTHAWFAFVVGSQFLALIYWNRAKIWNFALASFAAGIPFLVLWSGAFYHQLQNSATNWMPPFQLLFALDALLWFYGGRLAFLLYFISGVMLLNKGPDFLRKFLRPEVRALLAVFGLSLALPLLASAVKPIYCSNRYTIIALVPLAALLGGVFSRFGGPRLTAGACAVLFSLTLAARIQTRHLVLEMEGVLAEGQSDRTTASYIVRNATEGDAVVFTSLSRAAADYYFRRNGAAERFFEISFPPEIDRHLSWRDNRQALRDLVKLDREATEIVERLARLAAMGNKVWVYYGRDLQVSALLKGKLDGVLRLERIVNLSGPFHTQILVYRSAG